MSAINRNARVLWRKMMSMKFAIYLLCALCLASLLAILLPQSPPADFSGGLVEFYQLKYGSVLGNIFTFLGLHDIHGSMWYAAIIALLCFIICFTWFGRLPSIIRQIQGGVFLEDREKFIARQYHSTLTTRMETGRCIAWIRQVLKTGSWRLEEKQIPDGRLLLHGKKGAWSRMGMFVAHISLVVLLIGTMISEHTNFTHFQWLVPGQIISVPDLSHMASPGYIFKELTGLGDMSILHHTSVGVDSTDWRSTSIAKMYPVAMKVRLDKFNVSYTTRGKPKAFVSSLTVMDSIGKRVDGGDIMVNHPLVHDGVYYYQSSFMPAWDRADRVVLEISPADSSDGPWTVELTETRPTARIGETADWVSMVQFAGTLAPDKEKGRLDGLPGEHLNPAALLAVERAGERLIQTWVMKRLPASGAREGYPYHFKLVSYTSPYMAGITIRSHRAQNIIWFGLFMLVAGAVVAFLSRQRELWLMVRPDGENSTEIHLAGRHTRFEDKFSAEYSFLVDEITEKCGASRL